MRITIFGGASLKENDPIYQQAYQLGKFLAENDHTILTGGYVGVMEASSRGAAEAGGHVIGVTCDEIEHWRPISINPWVKEEWHFPTLRERLWSLLSNCDLAVAMPGGIGTMAEIAMLWNHLVIHSLSIKALIVIGEGWKKVFDEFFQNLGTFTPEQDRYQIIFVPGLSEAFQIISEFSNEK